MFASNLKYVAVWHVAADQFPHTCKRENKKSLPNPISHEIPREDYDIK